MLYVLFCRLYSGHPTVPSEDLSTVVHAGTCLTLWCALHTRDTYRGAFIPVPTLPAPLPAPARCSCTCPLAAHRRVPEVPTETGDTVTDCTRLSPQQTLPNCTAGELRKLTHKRSRTTHVFAPSPACHTVGLLF